MNESRVIAALSSVRDAARALGEICEREAPEYAASILRISASAGALASAPNHEDIEALRRSVASLLSRRPGSFSEVYIVRKDEAERLVENARFERAKDCLSAATGDLARAAREGEVNFGVVRRHLTDLESLLIAEDRPERTHIRELLNRDSKEAAEVLAVLALIDELEARPWPEALLPAIRAHVQAVRTELLPHGVRDGKEQP